MIDAVHHEIERYSNASICKLGEPLCDATMLGLLLRAFCKIGIYPEASAVTTKSVEEVRLILQTIEFPEYIPIYKHTGCCKSPVYPIYSPTVPICANCHKKYDPKKKQKANHAESCLPLTRLRKILDDIVAKVTGLVYSQFVCKASSPSTN